MSNPTSPYEFCELMNDVNLALAHAEQFRRSGQLDDAEIECRRAFELAKEHFGPRSVQAAVILNHLGAIHSAAGRFHEGHRAFVEALEITEQTLGPEDVQLANVYRNLANLELARGRCVTGESYARRSVEIREKAVEPQAVALGEDVAVLAGVLEGQGRHEESYALYRRALEIFEGACGPADQRARACRMRLESAE